MTPEEVLEKAAQALAEKGHCKGNFGDDEGRMCAVGAIRYAVSGSRGVYLASLSRPGDRELTDLAIQLLGKEIESRVDTPQGYYDYVPLFNDRPSTTGEDVILMMKRAANHDS